MTQLLDANNKGSIKVNYVKLVYPDNRELDLIPFVTQFNIYESIFEPCISATAAIDDSRGIIDNDLLAGLIVKIKYKTFEKIKFTEMTFVIDSVNAVIPNGNSTQIYHLKMFSEESKRALGLRVGEIYKNASPESMINDILQNKIKTKKNISLAKTSMVDSINCSNLYPFQAIDAIKRRSVSRDYKSSSFMFFENQNGFNFITLEEILHKASKDPDIISGDMIFYYDGQEPNNVKKTSWRRIEVLEKSRIQSMTENIQYGGLKSKILAYNLNTGVHYEFVYDYNSNDFKISKRSQSYSNLENIYQKGDEINNLIVAPIDDEADLLRIKKELLVKAYMTKLSSNIIRIEINGDSRLTVGDAADLKIPNLISSTDKTTNEISSGIYLFSKIRHIIQPADNKYRQSCEMIKAGFY